MSANSFGTHFRITTFGESHGEALGVVIDGCPAGIPWNQELLLKQMARRRPGSSATVSQRQEADHPRILSGVFEGKTLGTPIAIVVENTDARSSDYNQIQKQPRPGHADDVWKLKFGHVDHRGGGRSSGRETVARVMAGAVAQMFVQSLYPELAVCGWSEQIGPFQMSDEDTTTFTTDSIDQCTARFPGSQQKQVEELLLNARSEGQSFGGTARLQVTHVPAGLGQPVFHKFKSEWAQALMSVGATSGFELGDGQSATLAEGSHYHQQGEAPYGGIRGGITTGETLSSRVFFKPTSSVLDVAKTGRHDPCIVPRAIPVLEAMTWLVLADQILWRRSDV